MILHFPPNWFAAVMGTGVIAVAAAGLPWHSPVLDALGIASWLAATVLMAAVLTGTALHWRTDRDAAAAHRRDPVTAHFYGALPMAVLTVGTSTLVAGRTVLGRSAALAVDLVCFSVGTVAGVIIAVVVPWQRLLRAEPGRPFAGWLMPVVTPTVSASAAAVLAAELRPGAGQSALLLIGAAMLVLALVLTAPVMIVVLRGLWRSGSGPIGLVPTWWIVLGPLGQSVTAVCLLERAGSGLVGRTGASLLRGLALSYAVPVWTAALAWIGCALALTAAAVRRGLPFGLSWWSFTFPVGTFVTGSAGLAAVEGSMIFAVSAGAGFAALLAIWSLVALRTWRGVTGGTLLRPPVPAGAPARVSVSGQSGHQ